MPPCNEELHSCRLYSPALKYGKRVRGSKLIYARAAASQADALFANPIDVII